MYDLSTPLWERYLMTIEEASSYFRIGENKLRRIASEYKDECVVIVLVKLFGNTLFGNHALYRNSIGVI